jgi:hypothetical protein
LVRRDPADYEGQEMELVYIASRLEEAQNIEALLDQAGFDYTIQVEHYRAGIIFVGLRAGAFFYVLTENAGGCRQVLRECGYVPQEPPEASS